MRQVVDQMGRTVMLPEFPQRIVSLVPSQTELLYDLGLANSIVGQTVFCIHPKDQFHKANKIGGTKKLQIQKIMELQPDLIIGNKEENEKSQIEELEKQFPVWMSDIYDLTTAIEMIRGIGNIVQKQAAAEICINEIVTDFENLQRSFKNFARKSLYLIWKDPYMAAGQETFIHDIMNKAGFTNVITQKRYPELSESQIHALAPELVMLSSEPYPFKEKHISELKSLLPKAKILLVDGEMFSWYGSRLKMTTQYLVHLIKTLTEGE